ncbi:MAG: ABC transporter permease [Stutzerimonas stutzeri]|nr:MAG: ABC transporter permease [Stutzerimonas stutzeri]
MQRISAFPSVFGATVLAFLMLPILAVVPASFNDASFIKIPPSSYSFRWYHAFLNDYAWMNAVSVSFQVAVITTVISVIVGTMAALGLERMRSAWRGLFRAVLLAPMIVPVIMTSVALYYVMRRVGLQGNTMGLALGHTLLSLPFVVLNVGVSIAKFDQSLARAAAGLGASPLMIFRTITFPMIKPGIAAGAAFAFITSFDEAVLSLFLSGPGTVTLPIKLWQEIRIEFTPVSAVAATAILIVTIVVFLASNAHKLRRDNTKWR